MRILITPRSLTAAGLGSVAALEPLRARGWELVAGPAGRLPTEEELIAVLPGVDGWLAGVETITERALASADALRVISRNGVGADAVDLAAAEARGIEVVLARGANSRGVAELTLLLILTALRDTTRADASVKAGGWHRTLGREMPDSTVGLVGFGAIGRLVAASAAALGARVLAHDPYASDADIAAAGAEPTTLERLFSTADVVSLHSPPPADGSALVTRELLALLPEDAVLINTARSALVDDAAVLAALESGRLRSYAVDAFDAEPPELTPLLRHERTVTTPHLGGYTAASVRRATELSVANLIATLEV